MGKEKPIKVEAEVTTKKNVSSGIGKGFGITIGIFLALIVIAVSCGILISSQANKIQEKIFNTWKCECNNLRRDF